MSNVFEEITQLDRLIHEPSRLAILTALNACKQADFLFLRRLTGLSAGNLSVHLSKLEEAKLISIQKEIVAKRTHTQISITPAGIKTIQDYWQKMETMRRKADDWEMID